MANTDTTSTEVKPDTSKAFTIRLEIETLNELAALAAKAAEIGGTGELRVSVFARTVLTMGMAAWRAKYLEPREPEPTPPPSPKPTKTTTKTAASTAPKATKKTKRATSASAEPTTTEAAPPVAA